MPCNTNQIHIVSCNTIHCHAIPLNTLYYHKTPCSIACNTINTMCHHIIPRNTVQYHIILCNTIWYNTTIPDICHFFFTPPLISSSKYDTKKSVNCDKTDFATKRRKRRVVWSRMLWWDLKWCGVVWCGLLELTKVDFLFSSIDIHSFGIQWFRKMCVKQTFLALFQNFLTPGWKFWHKHCWWCWWQISGMCCCCYWCWCCYCCCHWCCCCSLFPFSSPFVRAYILSFSGSFF